MSISLATGTQVAIATTYGSPLAFTAPSNAAETVLLMASTTGLAAGDIVEVTSSWEFLNGRIARVKTVNANVSIVLELIDTTNTTRYPVGDGAGTVREITAFTSIPLIETATVAGGEQQYVPVPELSKFKTAVLPSEQTGITVTLPIYFEATPGAGVSAIIAAQGGSPVAMRATHPTDVLYANGNWAFRRFPTLARGEARRSEATFSQLAVEETVYPI